MSVGPEAPAASPTAGTTRRPMAYVPALDGLRAVAVVGVMLFHGGVSWMPGGYLGVDVFFVLSGYLITTLLLRERVGTGTIDLREFWVRRLRRLLPALLLLLAVVGMATPFLIDGPSRASVRGDGLAALGYVANWRFIFTEQSYFAGTPSPLRHLWSLAVEEQWYLLFPIVVALVLGRARRIAGFIVGLVVAAAASVLWMAHLVSGPVDPSRAYYGTDSRAHTLLIGSVLALVAAQWPLHRHRRALAAAGMVGAAGIIAAYLLVSEADTWMYRGGFAGLAVLTAGLVASIALPRGEPLPVARLFALRPLVAVGRVSYGLYLWHWPINVVLTPDRTGLDGSSVASSVGLLALRTAVAVAFTVVSYRLVEVPIRTGGLDGLRLRFPGVLRSRPATVATFAAVVVWLLFAGTLRVPDDDTTRTATGLPPELASAERGVPDLPDIPVPTIPDAIREVVEANGIPAVPADRPLKVMVVGDSVAFTLTYGVDTVPPTLEMSTRAIIGCGLVDGGFAMPGGKIDTSAQRCGNWTDYWQQGVQTDAPDVVMLQFGSWEVYDHKVGSEVIESGSEEMRQAIRDGLDKGIGAVLDVKPDVRFMFVGAPCMREVDPDLGGADSERNDPERVAWVNRVLEGYSDDLGDRSRFVHLGDLLCPDGEFREEIDGTEIRPDGSHFAADSTGPVWAWLAERLIASGRQPIQPAGGDPTAEDPQTDRPVVLGADRGAPPGGDGEAPA